MNNKLANFFAGLCCILTVTIPSFAANPVDCAPSSPAVIARTLVFSGRDSISKFYRIPAIAVAKDGTIVAVADRRLESNKDLPSHIDVVARRSHDGGLTWDPVIEVAVNDESGGYGDPALGINPTGDLVVVMTHGNGLWESTEDNHARILCTHSSDNGLTWSTPVDFTDRLYNSDGSAPVKAISAFATSGKIASLRDGTMMFCLVARDKEKKWSELNVYPVHSTDEGHTWEINPVSVDPDGDESKIVECPDSSLLMSIRSRHQERRKFSRSTDGGKTWSLPEQSPTLPDPACNGDIMLYHYNDRDYLLHSIPDSPEKRRNVSIFASDDNGASWRKLITVCPTLSMYSAITELPDGSLGCLAEENHSDAGQRIWFTKIDIRSLIDKQFGK